MGPVDNVREEGGRRKLDNASKSVATATASYKCSTVRRLTLPPARAEKSPSIGAGEPPNGKEFRAKTQINSLKFGFLAAQTTA